MNFLSKHKKIIQQRLLNLIHQSITREINSHLIDFVDIGKHQILIYTDDLAYSWVLDDQQHKSSLEHAINISKKGFKYANVDLSTVTCDNIIYHVIKHYWDHALPFYYLDIGSQYGTGAFNFSAMYKSDDYGIGSSEGRSALDIGSFIKANDQTQQVISFEPGIAGELLQANVDLNGLSETVTVERQAVSFSCMPTLLYYEIGHSEDCRILERFTERTRSMVVRCTSVDDYLASHHLTGYPIVKIDTQGAEMEVLEGMKHTSAALPVPIMLEFSPLIIHDDPVDFLKLLGTDALIFDLPVLADSKITAIQEDDFGSFISDVTARKFSWTDLLIMPNNLPFIDELLAKIDM